MHVHVLYKIHVEYFRNFLRETLNYKLISEKGKSEMFNPVLDPPLGSRY